MRLIAGLDASPNTRVNPAVIPSVPEKPAAEPEDSFSNIVHETYQTWRHEGGKIGKLAGASALGLVIPSMLASHLPAVAGIATHPVGLTVAITLACLEEETIGLGRRLGQATGAAIGAGVGVVQAMQHRTHPDRPLHRPRIQLPVRPATGAGPRERLLPAGLHRLERTLLGKVPARTRSTEMGEVLGMNLAIQAGSILVPMAIANATHGAVALVMQSLVGTIVGMVATGLVENRVGFGRALGELGGQAFSAVQARWNRGNKPAAANRTPGLVDGLVNGKMGQIARATVDRTNKILSDPLEGVLLDSAVLLNRLFAESPRQSMHFVERPAPVVDRARVVNSFTRLANLDGEAEVTQELCAHLDRLSIPWERKEDGTIVATVSGTVHDAPTVVLSAPLDHAHEERTDRTVIRRRLQSAEEGGDHRAGLAQIVEAVHTVLEDEERKHPELKLVFTARVTDERPTLRPEDISHRPAIGFVVDASSLYEINLTDDTVVLDTNSVKYDYTQEEPMVQVAMRAMADAGVKPRPVRALALTGSGTASNTPAFNSGHVRSIVVGNGMTDLHVGLRSNYIEQGARHLVGIIRNSADLRLEGDQVVPRHVLPEPGEPPRKN